MKIFSRLLILLCLLAVAISHGQAAEPKFTIVDAMPVVQESVGGPKYGMIGLDFLIGANPRPTWWGRDFVARFAYPNDFKARLTQTKAGQISETPLVYSAAYTPRWNESLGLYTVRVRAPMESEFWPKDVALNYAGTLPIVFHDQTQIGAPITARANLPFAVVFDARPAKGYADAQLISPAPSVWVKWVRVFRIETGPNSLDRAPKFEVDLMITGRLASEGKVELERSVQFTDAAGSPIRKNARFSYISKGFEGFQTNSAPVPIPYRNTRARFIWDENPNEPVFNDPWVEEAFRNGKTPLFSIRFPVKRDGQWIEGDVPANQWIVEPLNKE